MQVQRAGVEAARDARVPGRLRHGASPHSAPKLPLVGAAAFMKRSSTAQLRKLTCTRVEALLPFVVDMFL